MWYILNEDLELLRETKYHGLSLSNCVAKFIYFFEIKNCI